MLTPQEVQDKKFEKAVFGGYDMSGVDDFLEQLTADYAALYKENAVLKSKLKVLVDTVEEYRSVDEAMRRTLFSAQRTAEEMTKEAKAKAEEILRRANAESAESLRRYRAENEMELARHKILKEQTEQFVHRLTEAYHKQLESVAALQKQVLPPQQPQRSEVMTQTAQEISASMASLTREQPPAQMPAVQPPVREPQPAFELSVKGAPDRSFVSDEKEDTLTSRPRFDFPDLHSQFGQQYASHGAKE